MMLRVIQTGKRVKGGLRLRSLASSAGPPRSPQWAVQASERRQVVAACDRLVEDARLGRSVSADRLAVVLESCIGLRQTHEALQVLLAVSVGSSSASIAREVREQDSVGPAPGLQIAGLTQDSAASAAAGGELTASPKAPQSDNKPRAERLRQLIDHVFLSVGSAWSSETDTGVVVSQAAAVLAASDSLLTESLAPSTAGCVSVLTGLASAAAREGPHSSLLAQQALAFCSVARTWGTHSLNLFGQCTRLFAEAAATDDAARDAAAKALVAKMVSLEIDDTPITRCVLAACVGSSSGSLPRAALALLQSHPSDEPLDQAIAEYVHRCKPRWGRDAHVVGELSWATSVGVAVSLRQDSFRRPIASISSATLRPSESSSRLELTGYETSADLVILALARAGLEQEAVDLVKSLVLTARENALDEVREAIASAEWETPVSDDEDIAQHVLRAILDPGENKSMLPLTARQVCRFTPNLAFDLVRLLLSQQSLESSKLAASLVVELMQPPLLLIPSSGLMHWLLTQLAGDVDVMVQVWHSVAGVGLLGHPRGKLWAHPHGSTLLSRLVQSQRAPEALAFALEFSSIRGTLSPTTSTHNLALSALTDVDGDDSFLRQIIDDFLSPVPSKPLPDPATFASLLTLAQSKHPARHPAYWVSRAVLYSIALRSAVARHRHASNLAQSAIRSLGPEEDPMLLETLLEAPLVSPPHASLSHDAAQAVETLQSVRSMAGSILHACSFGSELDPASAFDQAQLPRLPRDLGSELPLEWIMDPDVPSTLPSWSALFNTARAPAFAQPWTAEELFAFVAASLEAQFACGQPPSSDTLRSCVLGLAKARSSTPLDQRALLQRFSEYSDTVFSLTQASQEARASMGRVSQPRVDHEHNERVGAQAADMVRQMVQSRPPHDVLDACALTMSILLECGLPPHLGRASVHSICNFLGKHDPSAVAPLLDALTSRGVYRQCNVSFSLPRFSELWPGVKWVDLRGCGRHEVRWALDKALTEPSAELHLAVGKSGIARSHVLAALSGNKRIVETSRSIVVRTADSPRA
jgi:hypothetical protein